MNSNSYPLNEFITLQRGFDLPSKDRNEGNIPVVASTSVNGYHDKAKVHAPGVVIGRSGSIGGGQFIKEDFWPLNTTLWVKDFKGHDERYIYYLLRNIDFSGFNVGSGVPTLNRNHLSSVTVQDIGGANEKKIAHILSTLDDKIELNRKMNQTLEAMAQALFKSWFVDFDPVHLKAKCTSEEELEAGVKKLGISREILELFPSEFVESEMGMIPLGWSHDVLRSICKVQSGYAFKGAWWQDTGIKVVKIKNINGTEVDTNDCQCVSQEIANKNAKFKLNHGDCLIAMTGATVGKVGIIDASEEEFLLNQRVGRFQPIEYYAEYVKTLTKTDKFFDAIQSEAQGSAQPNISATGIEEIKIVKPSNIVIEAFSKVLLPVYSKMLSHQSEVHTLQKTRDTLLPKLLSGELDVSKLKIAEEN